VISALQRPTWPTECVSIAAPLEPMPTETSASLASMLAKSALLEIAFTAPSVT
jgi:hypothetical protein